jgi:LysR family hydrogen peroxide-inducible transcriptional activator
MKNIRYFKSPAPVREVSIVTYRYFVKYHLIEVLKKEILANIPKEMTIQGKHDVTPIDSSQ